MSTTNGILLSEAIKKMEEVMKDWDLSDEYLQEYYKEDFWVRDRKRVFGLLQEYGITMVPCSFAIQLARKVLELEGDQVIPYQ